MIGVGVKNSTSDLLIANCDEFIFYDDLVREGEAKRRTARRRKESRPADATAEPGTSEEKQQEAIELVLETYEALVAERGEGERIWGSMVKQALKRRKPGFNESYYGFRAFSRPARRSREAQAARARTRRQIGRLRRTARLRRDALRRSWIELLVDHVGDL